MQVVAFERWVKNPRVEVANQSTRARYPVWTAQSSANTNRCTEPRRKCKMYICSTRPGVFLAGRPHVHLIVFRIDRRSRRSIVQNQDTSVRCICLDHDPAFFQAGRPARKHESILHRSIVQNPYTSVTCMLFKLVTEFFLAGLPENTNHFRAGRFCRT